MQVVFDDGASKDAVLFTAPAGEDGQYYCLPFKGASDGYNGHVVFYDSQGHVLNSRFAQF